MKLIMVSMMMMLIGCSAQEVVKDDTQESIKEDSTEEPVKGSLDRSCNTDEDCKQVCHIGCINLDQPFEEPIDIACEEIICNCVNGICDPFWG